MSVHAGYLSFWGKAERAPGGGSWHPAAYHMLDVAAVTLVFLQKTCPTVPGYPAFTAPQWSTVAFLIALHDIGKFSRPFQQKILELWPECLGMFAPDQAVPHHDSAGFWMLTERLLDIIKDILPGLEASEQRQIFRAICGHHGRPPVEQVLGAKKAACSICLAQAARFVQDVRELLAPVPLLIEDPQAFSWWLAGLTVFADWIGSNDQWFPYEAPCADLAVYWVKAQARATVAVQEAGVLPVPLRPGLDIAALLPDGASAAPLQALAAKLELGARDTPALIIIEDQTGSGKTEAALLLAHRLMIEKSACGLFLALPTMATANALYGRLNELYRKLFAPNADPSLVLAHGKVRLHERFMASVRRDDTNTPADDAADETASAQCAGWIAEDRRRTFLADCGVGTIDQALHAVLPTRHAPLRLFGLSNRVLIVDEAHAYDTYMQEELFRLIEFQRKLGGSAIILSATLPRTKRQDLVRAFGCEKTCENDGYPLVTIAAGESLTETSCAANASLQRNIAVTRLPDAAAAIRVIAETAVKGAAIGWIRNTVDEAIAAQGLLCAAGIEAILFHARFAMGDRQVIETEAQRRVGRKSDGALRQTVIIGTQVMEQSLDIDFDLLVSDLAPVDLLLQRAGRLWRHQRDSRPVAAPAFYIISPEPVAAPPKDWLRDNPGTAAVYRHPALLWRSARAIFAAPNLALPADVRGLVEAVYAQDAETPKHLQEKSDAAEGANKSAASIAWMNLLKWEDGYSTSNGAWESDVKTPTRLSEPSRTFRLAVASPDGLRPWFAHEDEWMAWALSEIALPLRLAETAPLTPDVMALQKTWSKFDQETPVLVLHEVDGTWEAEALGKNGKLVQLRYGAARGLNTIPKIV